MYSEAFPADIRGLNATQIYYFNTTATPFGNAFPEDIRGLNAAQIYADFYRGSSGNLYADQMQHWYIISKL